ncbi:isocitrate lyase/PEP mutase family protein [Chitinophaga sp. 22321]|uniref:Isocitrate lyase/phosphoenolpyruvate mutase family protein n=1 Tax=Chitinophaga hostae TaxID=2831022 RepID=A0ABS5J792_9BACT|nr:isocitrate lyase/phosphoenolpyruvate mutase family protein [Chitinophaga hostae]MBS0031050.1 isocitrate lyase/phosphoenolpyruvate mutase family protein [Chitinophaga hostae]
MGNYETFYQLHHKETPLILANAWNVKSAQIIEQNGYDAIGTSSGAISNSLGYEDGEKMPFDELFFVVQRIKASTNIPLSVDLERGYTNDLAVLTENIQRLVDIGVAGINLEDAQGEEIYLKKLHSIKNYLEKSNQKIFINARTDGFLLKVDAPLETTIKRAKAYQDAGADGLFVTAVSDTATIKEIASSTTLPLNVVGSPKLSSIQTLSECGVRRISMAVLLYRASYNQLDKLIKEVSAQQSFGPLF